MNTHNSPIDYYLAQVRQHLEQKLPPSEIEDILSELHMHIWDSANQISRNSNNTLEQSFNLAIQQLEDPGVLASRFTENVARAQPYEHQTSPARPVIPEQKLDPHQFAYIAIGGLVISAFILLLLEISLSRMSDSVNFSVLSMSFQTLILILGITGYLFYRDNKKYQDQSIKFRENIKKQNQKDISTKTRLSFLGAHLEGMIEVIGSFVAIILILYVSYATDYQLFNDNWYNLVIYVTIGYLVLSMITGGFKTFVGQIRITPLLNATNHIANAILLMIAINFYPYTFDVFFASFESLEAHSIFDSIDQSVVLIMSFMVILAFMQAIYNVFKYGNWKPQDKKSLVIT